MNMIMDTTQQQQQQQQQQLEEQQQQQQQELHINDVSSEQHELITVINNNNNNINNNKQLLNNLTLNGKTQLKRSFDVAFLMMPDERIKQKQAEKQARCVQQQQQHQQPQQQQQLQVNTDTCERRNYAQLSLRSPRIYDDPSVLLPTAATDVHLPLKSAFTKVCASNTLEIAPPLSPDQLSCPSMSPPVATTPPRTNSGNGSLSNGSTGNSSGLPCLNPNIVYQSFRPDYQFNGAFQSVNQVHQRLKQQLFYRPPVSTTAGPASPTTSADFLAVSGYAGFPFPTSPHPFTSVSPPELPRLVQNPAAAAILSTLIPPTLASTFTLTAQNVCAKCNISFRMTSDLVYHMRSHHKSEVACDPNRRKREDKLKCPVCQESFRERHHLTRHMTAHQDKESDQPTAAKTMVSDMTTLNRSHMSRVASASK